MAIPKGKKTQLIAEMVNSGQSYDQVAKALSVSNNSIRCAIYHARKKGLIKWKKKACAVNFHPAMELRIRKAAELRGLGPGEFIARVVEAVVVEDLVQAVLGEPNEASYLCEPSSTSLTRLPPARMVSPVV